MHKLPVTDVVGMSSNKIVPRAIEPEKKFEYCVNHFLMERFPVLVITIDQIVRFNAVGFFEV